VLGALGILSAALIGCGPQPQAAAGASQEAERFGFIRARVGVVRIDTSTGQVWTVPTNGDGGWAPRGAEPDAMGLPTRNGRYRVMSIASPRGNVRVGGQTDPVLMRVDRETGRGWLLESEDATAWVAIRDASAPVVGTTGSSSPSTPAATASAAPVAPRGSRVLDESTDDQYPILTGDQLGVTPEEKQQTIETLRTARTKEGLPRKMRIWSVRQLGQVDPDLAVPELLVALEDDDPAVVAEAVTQLGQIGRASTIPRILKLRDHPDAEVREAVSTVIVEVE
jgi:hypothetical protein